MGYFTDMAIAFFLGTVVGFFQIIIAARNPLYANVLESTAALITSFAARAFASIGGSDQKYFSPSSLCTSQIAVFCSGREKLPPYSLQVYFSSCGWYHSPAAIEPESRTIPTLPCTLTCKVSSPFGPQLIPLPLYPPVWSHSTNRSRLTCSGGNLSVPGEL